MLALVALEVAECVATLRRGRVQIFAPTAATAFLLPLTPANAYAVGSPLIAAAPAYLPVRHVRARPHESM